jgi:hypothetical protein
MYGQGCIRGGSKCIVWNIIARGYWNAVLRELNITKTYVTKSEISLWIIKEFWTNVLYLVTSFGCCWPEIAYTLKHSKENECLSVRLNWSTPCMKEAQLYVGMRGEGCWNCSSSNSHLTDRTKSTEA